MEYNELTSSDPEIIVDDLFGKKARARRKAKRAARKKGKSQGLKGKALRRFARAGRQAVRATQLEKKAARKGGRKSVRLLRKAKRVRSRKGETSVGRGIRTAVFTPLLPFKKPMMAALKRAGVSPVPTRMRSLVPIFYKKIVKKDSYELSDNVEPVTITIGAIISAIIAFFKIISSLKKEGKDLTPVEQIIADGTDNAIANIKAKHESEAINKGLALAKTPADATVTAKEMVMEPLRPVMASSLANLGTPPPSDIQPLTTMFYNRVVARNVNTYEGIDSVDGQGIVFATVVPAVIGFLTALKNKKSSGQKLTKLESNIVDKTEKVEATIMEKADDTATFKIGEFIRKPTTLIIIGVVIVGGVILVMKK